MDEFVVGLDEEEAPPLKSCEERAVAALEMMAIATTNHITAVLQVAAALSDIAKAINKLAFVYGETTQPEVRRARQ